jgi:hypothetical protein
MIFAKQASRFPRREVPAGSQKSPDRPPVSGAFTSPYDGSFARADELDIRRAESGSEIRYGLESGDFVTEQAGGFQLFEEVH